MTKRLRIIIAAAAPLCAVLIFALRGYIGRFAGSLPKCFLHETTGFWCAGCGNTRSVMALLHGHIFLAIRNNPTIPFLSLLLLLLYAENFAAIFGKEIRLLPRRMMFWYIVIALFMIFFVVRNFFRVLGPVS